MHEQPESSRQYAWPKYVLAAFVLAILLAVIWMSVAVRKAREYRDPTTDPRNRPSPATETTNSSAPAETTR